MPDEILEIKSLALTVKTINMKRRELAQLPWRLNYTREQFKQALCWVYADAVWSKKDSHHQPVMLCEFPDDNTYAWVNPGHAPQAHIRRSKQGLWIDNWTGRIIPHAIVR